MQLIFIILSGLTIAIADALIKKVSVSHDVLSVLFTPTMIGVYILYFVQILFTFYIFAHNEELAIYSDLFIVFYSISSIALGFLLFRETLSLVQVAGIGVAIIGVLMMSSGSR